MAEVKMEIVGGVERKDNDAIVNITLSKLDASMPPQIESLQLRLKNYAHASDEKIQLCFRIFR